MSRPEGDGPPHVRALTVHDVKRGTARLRTEIELPTFEEFTAMVEKIDPRWGTLLRPDTNPALKGEGPDDLRCNECGDVVAAGVWETLLYDFGIICAKCGAVYRLSPAPAHIEGEHVYWAAGVYPLPSAMLVLPRIPIVGERRAP